MLTGDISLIFMPIAREERTKETGLVGEGGGGEVSDG